jgi:hypothetical protein
MKIGKYFIIKLVVYPFDVMVSIDESDEVLLKRLEKYGNSPDDCMELMDLSDTVRGRAIMLPSNQSVIRFKTISDKSELLSCISHEVFHITTFIMDRVGIKFELMVSDEAYAYLHGFIFLQICKKVL